jgi:hypothetical protein
MAGRVLPLSSVNAMMASMEKHAKRNPVGQLRSITLIVSAENLTYQFIAENLLKQREGSSF